MLDRPTTHMASHLADPREALIADEVMASLEDAVATLQYLKGSLDRGFDLDSFAEMIREAATKNRAILDFARKANALSRAA